MRQGGGWLVSKKQHAVEALRCQPLEVEGLMHLGADTAHLGKSSTQPEVEGGQGAAGLHLPAVVFEPPVGSMCPFLPSRAGDGSLAPTLQLA